ncbi:MAG: transposase [Leptospiraceae bacterium]|nr:transposase [Leptospiraceae bacterium]
MTDGYHEYERIFGMFPLIILANCMAHARRYFEEATNSK